MIASGKSGSTARDAGFGLAVAGRNHQRRGADFARDRAVVPSHSVKVPNGSHIVTLGCPARRATSATLEDDDDLDEYEDDEVDQEEELGSTLPSDLGYDDPYDPNNQAGDPAVGRRDWSYSFRTAASAARSSIPRHAADRTRRRTDGRRRTCRPRHDQHGTHRCDLRHRRRTAALAD